MWKLKNTFKIMILVDGKLEWFDKKEYSTYEKAHDILLDWIVDNGRYFNQYAIVYYKDYEHRCGCAKRKTYIIELVFSDDYIANVTFSNPKLVEYIDDKIR